jgi:hypothetical protein
MLTCVLSLRVSTTPFQTLDTAIFKYEYLYYVLAVAYTVYDRSGCYWYCIIILYSTLLLVRSLLVTDVKQTKMSPSNEDFSL